MITIIASPIFLKNNFFTCLLPHHRCEHCRRRRRHREHRPRRVNDVIQHLAPGLDRIVGQHVLHGGHRLVGRLGPGIFFDRGEVTVAKKNLIFLPGGSAQVVNHRTVERGKARNCSLKVFFFKLYFCLVLKSCLLFLNLMVFFF